jgi:hypothetical protein
MTDTVYDATVVGYSNGDLAGRRNGNILDQRLTYLEDFLAGRRAALYNDKLTREYDEKVRSYRNDVVEAFIEALESRGRRAARSKLSSTDYAKSRDARWPSHDQHLLAAALTGGRTVILVTERALADCRTGVKRHFGFRVVRT